MQEGAARDDLDFLGRNAHGASERDGIGRDALGVALGFRVLQVECVAEGLKRDVVGVLEIFHGVAQHLGAGANHFFEALVVVLGFFERLAMIEGALDGVEQLVALKRLEQVVVCAAAHGVDSHADVVNGGDHDDGKIGLEGVNALEQGDAADVVHDDVSEHQVEGVHLENFESVAAVAGLLNGVALALEGGGDHGADGRFVVDNENPRRLTRTCVAFVSRAPRCAHRFYVCQR